MSKKKQKGKKPPAPKATPPQQVEFDASLDPAESGEEAPVVAAGPRRRSLWRYRLGVASIVAGVGCIKLMVLLVVIWLQPNAQDLTRTDRLQPTVVYSLDGVKLTTFDNPAKRRITAPDSIPTVMKDALMLTLDPRFRKHSGLRITGRGTLTTLLARKMYDEVDGPSQSWWRKAKELVLALSLERRFTKDEILAHYLNFADFGSGLISVQNASRHFFGRPPQQLREDEAVLLIAMLRAPTAFNPRRHLEKAIEQRNKLLQKLYDADKIKRKDLRTFRERDLELASVVPDVYEQPLAPYFRDHLQQWLGEWAEQNDYDLARDGLKVYTTIHSKLQAHAEGAVYEHLSAHQPLMNEHVEMMQMLRRKKDILRRTMRASDRYKKMKAKGATEAQIDEAFRTEELMRVFSWNERGYVDTLMTPMDSLAYYARMLECGFVVINPYNGYVMAWVGGNNHHFFQYDHAWQGRRQVGSTFKPFVYTAAFDNDIEPCYKLLNQPVQIPTPEGDMWEPKNADHDYSGEVSLRYGLVNSVNVVTARLIQEIGPDKVIDYARKMGVQSPLKPVPSIALGTFDLTVAELTSAYGVFPAGGVHCDPVFVTHIEDRTGKIVASYRAKRKEAIKPQTAFLMVQMLRQVATNGTAGSLRYRCGLPWDMDLSGKTGTTQNSADGWFVGFTPHLVAGVWVGCNDQRVNFGHSYYGRGSHMAMPIWGNFMRRVYFDKNLPFNAKDQLKPPPNYFKQIYCPGDPVKRVTDETVEESDSTAAVEDDPPESKSKDDGWGDF